MDAFLKNITHQRWLGFLLTAAVVLTAYSFVLKAPFRNLDDTTMIVSNENLRSLENFSKIFTSSFFGDRSYYRPLVLASYMIEYHFFGLDPFFYYLDNVLLHILNAFGVYFLVFRLFKDRSLSWWVSFLFAIHPVQWEAVANVSGRVILLNTFFLLLSFGWFIDFRERRRMVCLAGSILSFFLALLCKESAAMLPVVLLLYLAFYSDEKPRPWPSVAPFFLIVVGMILWRRQLGITELFAWGSLQATLLGFLTFARGMITYLRLFVFPVDLYFDRSRMVFQNFADVQLLATVAFWLAALVLLWRARARIDRKVLFLILWFALEFAPVSQIVTSLGVQPGFISLAEHFLYLPSIAILTVAVLGLRRVGELNRARRWFSPAIGGIAVAGFLLFLLLTTVQQNIYASNDLAMLTRSLQHQPVNSRLQYSVGMHYVQKGNFPTAERYFAQAVLMDPWNVRARIALAKSLCDQGRYDEGIAVYTSIRDAGPLQGLLDENLRLSYKLRDQRRRRP
jgi:tetratricopeptide (TPR) repeat protein